MSKLQKLIQKVLDFRTVSYEEAENILKGLGFALNIKGSHHIFRKAGYPKNLSFKRRSQLLTYQINKLREVLKDHGY
jgi:predicted RNA binding protein YcfA (HicA-like mRNA interferase family)